MSCKAGKHKWASGKGQPGEKCKKCGDPYRGRGRPSMKAQAIVRRPPAAAATKPKPAAARPVADDAAARLAAALGTPSPTTPAPDAAAVTVLPPGAPLEADKEDDQAEKDVDTTCAWIARRVTRVFVHLTDWAIGLANRDAGEHDDEDEAQFAEGLSRSIRAKWEDRGLSPAWQMGLAGGFIVGEMCIGSEKRPEPEKKPARIAPPPPLNTPSNGASVAATTVAAIPLHD
jgi:hypothetical protein